MNANVDAPTATPGLFARALDEHLRVARLSCSLDNQVALAAEAIVGALRAGKKILLCGNGGSAADSQHIAAEITVGFEKTRRPLPAIALTTDSSALTACVNDLGSDSMFARQVAALGNRDDVLIAFSTSGNSGNVNAALSEAKRLGMLTVGLSGRDGGRLRPLSDHCIIVPSNNTARIQEMHIVIGHAICSFIDAAFGD